MYYKRDFKKSILLDFLRARRIVLRGLLGIFLSLGLIHQQAHAQSDRDASMPYLEKLDKILILGDSLSAEYGLTRGTGWVAIVGMRLQNEGYKYQIINASISGETSAGGLSRFAALMDKHQPKIVVVELGGNDALRGLNLNATRNNLAAIIKRAQAQKKPKAKVLLLGMQVPPNFGASYTKDFQNIYPKLAKEFDTELVPFFLEGLSNVPKYFQADRIHPNRSAQNILAENVWLQLKPLL